MKPIPKPISSVVEHAIATTVCSQCGAGVDVPCILELLGYTKGAHRIRLHDADRLVS